MSPSLLVPVAPVELAARLPRTAGSFPLVPLLDPCTLPNGLRSLSAASKRLAALDSLAGERYPHMAAAGVAVQACFAVAMHQQSRVSPEHALRMLRCLQLLLSSGTAWLRSGPRSAARKFGADPVETLLAMARAVNDAFTAVQSHWPTCFHSLAATAAPPELLVGWLAAVVEAVEWPHDECHGFGA